MARNSAGATPADSASTSASQISWMSATTRWNTRASPVNGRAATCSMPRQAVRSRSRAGVVSSSHAAARGHGEGSILWTSSIWGRLRLVMQNAGVGKSEQRPLGRPSCKKSVKDLGSRFTKNVKRLPRWIYRVRSALVGVFRMLRRSLIPSVLVLVALAALQAQTPAPRPVAPMPGADPALFKGLQYRLVGPSRGGRVTTMTGVPSQPRTFYMGVASGGLFRTTDNGATWTPLTAGKVPVGSMGSIAVADSDPNVLYLGTGSDGVRSNVSTGRGVYKSTDA